MYFSKYARKVTLANYLGINMNLANIAQHFPIIALSLIAVFGARAATPYPLLAATTRFARENIPNSWKQWMRKWSKPTSLVNYLMLVFI